MGNILAVCFIFFSIYWVYYVTMGWKFDQDRYVKQRIVHDYKQIKSEKVLVKEIMDKDLF